MRLFVILFLLSGYVHAGDLVDDDNDGLFCVMEDGENDGDPRVKFCGEDDQDRCDGIPNVSRDDGHCSMDFNDDGLFTLADVWLILTQHDHFLSGIPYPNYVEVGVPRNFGGFVCYDMMRVIEYNNRLTLAGLPLLQRDLPFLVESAGVHCFGHHAYPPIL